MRTPCAPTAAKAEITVNIEPRALDDETVLERVMVIARNRALAVHHVTVHAIEGRLSVSLDLEVDGSARARRRARDRQRARRGDPRRTGAGGRSRDPYRAAAAVDEPGRDAPPERVAAVRDALIDIAAKVDFVGEVHDVRVREIDDGEIVNFHCRVDPALKVADVHDKVDEVERALRLRFPAIKRVIGHAEPP